MKGTVGAKMPKFVALDKIFFFPRFRDESTNVAQRRLRWTELCKEEALRIKRLLSNEPSIVEESRSLSLESQRIPTNAFEPSADSSLTPIGLKEVATDDHVMGGTDQEQASADMSGSLPGSGDPITKCEPLDAFQDASIIPDTALEPPIKTESSLHDQSEMDFKFDPEASSREASIDADSPQQDDDAWPDDNIQSGEPPVHGKSNSSPDVSNSQDTQAAKPEPSDSVVKEEVQPDLVDSKVKDEIKPEPSDLIVKEEVQSDLVDSKVKDEIKPDSLDQKPKAELKIHPFFDLQPNPSLVPRFEKPSSSPSTASSTSLEAELLKSPTDVEWETIKQKTDVLKHTFGLTFEPLDIMLVQRFLTMRKVSFSEQTVRDLTHLLHHKLYTMRPPKSQSARIKTIKSVVKDMVVLHIGRCLDRGKVGAVEVGKEERGSIGGEGVSLP